MVELPAVPVKDMCLRRNSWKMRKKLWLISMLPAPLNFGSFSGLERWLLILMAKNSQLKLNHDGNWGTFEDFSGKEYDLVSSAALKPNATVFTSSSSGGLCHT